MKKKLFCLIFIISIIFNIGISTVQCSADDNDNKLLVIRQQP